VGLFLQPRNPHGALSWWTFSWESCFDSCHQPCGNYRKGSHNWSCAPKKSTSQLVNRVVHELKRHPVKLTSWGHAVNCMPSLVHSVRHPHCQAAGWWCSRPTDCRVTPALHAVVRTHHDVGTALPVLPQTGLHSITAIFIQTELTNGSIFSSFDCGRKQLTTLRPVQSLTWRHPGRDMHIVSVSTAQNYQVTRLFQMLYTIETFCTEYI